MNEYCAECGHPKVHHKMWAGSGNAYCFAEVACKCPDYKEPDEQEGSSS